MKTDADFEKINDKDMNNLIVLDCFDKILISYAYEKNDKCCSNCIQERFINTRKDRVYLKSLNIKNKIPDAYKKCIISIGCILKNDSKLIDEYERRKVYFLDKNTLEISVEYVSAVPNCSICDTIPIDSAELAEKEGRELIAQINQTSDIPFRNNNCIDLANKVENIVLSKNFGIITTLLDNYEGPFPIAVAMLPLEDGRDEPGTGRTDSIEKSRAVALLEAFERYGGFLPRGKKVNIYADYNKLKNSGFNMFDLKKAILNQNSITNESLYKNIKFYFDKSQNYHWVYGYSLTKQRSLLVPEALAYYGVVLKGDDYRKEILTYEISNGCSVGSSLLEATYHSLLEILERDAFLTSWYTDRKIRRIILDDVFLSEDSKLKSEFEIFKKYYHEFRIDIYDISCEFHIPVVLMTVTRKEIDKKQMNFMCAAAADENIYDAVEKALHEISSIFMGLQKKFKDEYQNIQKKAEDLISVETMDDHSMVWGYYKNLKDIKFADQVSDVISISEWDKQHETICSLNSSFKKLIYELNACGKEVIIVNQTTEEMSRINMSCAKVFVPGLLPMTFGASNARISLERIKEIEEMEHSKLNIRFIPHPFP